MDGLFFLLRRAAFRSACRSLPSFAAAEAAGLFPRPLLPPHQRVGLQYRHIPLDDDCGDDTLLRSRLAAPLPFQAFSFSSIKSSLSCPGKHCPLPCDLLSVAGTGALAPFSLSR